MDERTGDRPADRLRIERAGPDDAATVHALACELAAHEGELESLTVTESRWRELLDRDDVTVLVAILEGEAVGYVSAVDKLHLWSGADIVALDDLYVSATARNAGVGAALMRALAHRSDRPIKWEVGEENLAGQRFYERLGASLRRKVIAWWEPHS